MLEKAAFPSSFIITILTTITYSFLQRLHMLEKMAFAFIPIVTKLTTINNSFKQRLHMSEKAAFKDNNMIKRGRGKGGLSQIWP